MRTGLVLVDRDDRIVYASDTVRAAVGDIVGMSGWTLVTIQGRPCTHDGAMALHRAVRETGELKVTSGFVLTGPAGSIFVSAARIQIFPADPEKLVSRWVFDRLTGGGVCGMVVGGEIIMPTTGAEAVRADAVSEALDGWKNHLEARGRAPRYVTQSIKIVKDAAALRGWASLPDITSREIDAYLNSMGSTGTTKNRHLGCISAFLGFCWRTERIKENPARRVLRAQEYREGGNRAFNAEEAAKVIAAARADAESPTPRFKALDRWKLYLTAWHTGLRRSELRNLEVREVRLNDSPPRLVLRARNAKARREQVIPLHPELVPVLRTCIADKHPTDKVFGYLHDRIVPQDIIAAGVARVIDGHTTGLHSFRKGMATELALAGVEEAVAQKLLRHSDPKLTRNVYTDARLLPLASSVARVRGVTGFGGDEKNLVKGVDTETDFADAVGAEAKDPMKCTPANHGQTTPGRSAASGALSLHCGGPQQSAAPAAAGRPESADQPAGFSSSQCRRQESNPSPDAEALARRSGLMPTTVSGSVAGSANNEVEDGGARQEQVVAVRVPQAGRGGESVAHQTARSVTAAMPHVRLQDPAGVRSQDQEVVTEPSRREAGCPSYMGGSVDAVSGAPAGNPERQLSGVTPRRDGENSADPVATCDAGDDAACGKRVGEPWSHDTGTAPRAGVSREVWQNAVGQVCGAEVGRKGQAPLREPNPPSETGATPVLLTSEATRGGSSHPGVGPDVAGPAPFSTHHAASTAHHEEVSHVTLTGHTPHTASRGSQYGTTHIQRTAPVDAGHAVPLPRPDGIRQNTPPIHDLAAEVGWVAQPGRAPLATPAEVACSNQALATSDTPHGARIADAVPLAGSGARVRTGALVPHALTGTCPQASASATGLDDTNAKVEAIRSLGRSAVAVTNQESDVRNAFMTAAAAILTLAVGASALQPVTRGYANGKDCYWGSPAHWQPTVTLCVAECDKACPQFLSECALMCAGGTPPDQMIREVKDAALYIQSGGADPGNAIRLIEIAAQHPDPDVRTLAVAMGGETPFVHVAAQREVPGFGG